MVLRGILARSEWKEFESDWPVWRRRRPWRCMPPRSGSWGRVPAGNLNPGPSVQGSLAPAHHTSPPWSGPGTGPSQHWLVSEEESGERNQVEVSWYIGVFTRLSSWEPGFESHHRVAAALLSFSKAIYPHCCSRPRCINGDPVGGDRLLCLNLPAPL